MFITFEGIGGCGKTTQLRILAERLRNMELSVTETFDPGGTRIGQEIRTLLLDPASNLMSGNTEVLLFMASRAQLASEVIRPALNAGGIVLCDRFVDSTRAYQGGGQGVPIEKIEMLNVIACDGLEPDLTIILHVDVDIAMARAHGIDRFDGKKFDFQSRVRDAYLDLARRQPGRVTVIDGRGSVDQVAAAVWQVVLAKLTRVGLRVREAESLKPGVQL